FKSWKRCEKRLQLFLFAYLFKLNSVCKALDYMKDDLRRMFGRYRKEFVKRDIRFFAGNIGQGTDNDKSNVELIANLCNGCRFHFRSFHSRERFPYFRNAFWVIHERIACCNQANSV